MKNVWKMAFLSTVFVLTACKGGGGGAGGGGISVSDPNTIRGVAATGAPIVSGEVEVKGANGAVVKTITSSAGAYSVGVSALTEPYLVRVLAPSGQKYISVASQSDLAEGKKINVTPLTHMIVANVFKETNADKIFSDFVTEANEFTKEKLKNEKDNLLEKFKAAGLAGTGKIVTADVDLLNGTIEAGTSKGIDGLLDVIDVKTDAPASTGIEVVLKGVGPIIIDKVEENVQDQTPTTITENQLGQVQAQLNVIEQVRKDLSAFSTQFFANSACNGPATDSGLCGKQALYDTMKNSLFHPSFLEGGLDKFWGYFCKTNQDLLDMEDAVDAASCNYIRFVNVEFKDVTLISSKDGEVNISMNTYVNGKLTNADDEMTLKLDNNKYKLYGDRRTFAYWVSPESRHTTTYNKSTLEKVDSYGISYNFYYEGPGVAIPHTFTGDVKFKLTAMSEHEIFSNDMSNPRYLDRFSPT